MKYVNACCIVLLTSINIAACTGPKSIETNNTQPTERISRPKNSAKPTPEPVGERAEKKSGETEKKSEKKKFDFEKELEKERERQHKAKPEITGATKAG